MKKTVLFLSAFSAALAAWAVPTVGNVQISQNENKVVNVTYDLADEPAVVLATFLTNGVPVAGETALVCRGQVNRLVPVGASRTFTWFPRKTIPDLERGVATLSVKLTAFATNCLPQYLMVDLREQNRVIYFADEASLPGGSVTNELFKKDAILFFKAPARNVTWRMGTAPGEPSPGGREYPHLVTFTDDFYIGVYAFTQGQYRHIAENSFIPSGDTLPVHTVSYDEMRGTQYSWPGDGHKVAADSVLGLLRDRCGVEIDLPTDAQWEFACRAGTTTMWNNWGWYASRISDVAWCAENTGMTGSNDGGPLPVGGRQPNPWGLYDFHGNVWEWVLDWNQDILSENTTDPAGPTTGTVRVYRGGCFWRTWTYCRAGHRNNGSSAHRGKDFGHRLACPATAW